MSETPLFLKPAAGVTLVMPDGSIFPPAGDYVAPDLFIRRRMADGELVAVEPPAEPKATGRAKE